MGLEAGIGGGMYSGLGQMQQCGLDALNQQQLLGAQQQTIFQGLYNQQTFAAANASTKGVGTKKMNMVREYINKHRDVIFTLVVALLVDHFVLNGALRSRIQRVIEAALEKMEKALGVSSAKDVTA